jgi:hypothetical protein
MDSLGHAGGGSSYARCLRQFGTNLELEFRSDTNVRGHGAARDRRADSRAADDNDCVIVVPPGELGRIRAWNLGAA